MHPHRPGWQGEGALLSLAQLGKHRQVPTFFYTQLLQRPPRRQPATGAGDPGLRPSPSFQEAHLDVPCGACLRAADREPGVRGGMKMSFGSVFGWEGGRCSTNVPSFLGLPDLVSCRSQLRVAPLSLRTRYTLLPIFFSVVFFFSE